MGFFKKGIKFVSATCPECKGHLELDANLERAFCQYCGAQCIVENAPKKAQKKNNLETVLDFVERQQNLRRQDKREQQRRKDEEERKQAEQNRKYWWAYLLMLGGIMLVLVVLAILGEQGII